MEEYDEDAEREKIDPTLLEEIANERNFSAGDVFFVKARYWAKKKKHNYAFHFYKRAVEHGHIEAMTCLGNYYSEGSEVERNFGKAIAWYARAGNLQNAHAIENLFIYFKIRKDFEEQLVVGYKESKCGFCGSVAQNTCSGCSAQKYCSLKCQREDWRRHKTFCSNYALHKPT